MKNIKNIMLAMLFVASGLHAGQQAIDAQQDQIANKMIQAMQECIEFHEDAQWKLLGIRTANNSLNNVIDNQSAWEKAVGLYHTYIGDLRAKYNEITRPGLTVLPEISKDADLQTRLMIQANQSQFLFTRLLDEYIAHFGQVYEKQGTLLNFYRTAYYISSRGNQSLAITPNQYPALMQILDKAMLQKDWSSSVDLKVIIAQENRSMIEKTLALHEIINALKLVPLPVQYSTAAKIAMGVGAAAVVGAGAYAAYQMYGAQPADVATDATPTPAGDINALGDKVAVISQEAQDLPLEPATSPRSMQTPNWIAGGDAENYGMPAGSSGEDELEIMNTLGNSTPVQAIVGSQAMTVPNWQAGGDAEVYGASGLSGEDLINATSLMGTGQLVGGLGKAALNKAGNFIVGGEQGIAEGVTKGIANFEKTSINAPITAKQAPQPQLKAPSAAKQAALDDIKAAKEAQAVAEKNAAYYNNNVWEQGGIKAKEMNQLAAQAAQKTQDAENNLRALINAPKYAQAELKAAQQLRNHNAKNAAQEARNEAQATINATQNELNIARQAQTTAEKNAAYYNNNVWEKGGIKTKEMNQLAAQAAQKTKDTENALQALIDAPKNAKLELQAARQAETIAKNNAAYYNNNVWERGGIKAKEMNEIAAQAAQKTKDAENAVVKARPFRNLSQAPVQPTAPVASTPTTVTPAPSVESTSMLTNIGNSIKSGYESAKASIKSGYESAKSFAGNISDSTSQNAALYGAGIGIELGTASLAQAANNALTQDSSSSKFDYLSDDANSQQGL